MANAARWRQLWPPAAPAFVLGDFTGENLSFACEDPEPGVGWGAVRGLAGSSCALLTADSDPGRHWLGNVLQIGGSTGADNPLLATQWRAAAWCCYARGTPGPT